MGDQVLLDPLRGEVFRLSSYLHAQIVPGFHRAMPQSVGINEYTIAMSRVLVGPPPESTTRGGSHNAKTVVLVSGLLPNLTDAQLKRECIETIGRPRFIYMHVSDVKSGLFSGTAVIEFVDAESANKALSGGIAGFRVRPVTDEEFASLTSGDWPMLEYGPPQGVFSQLAVKPAVPVPVWAQPGRAPVSNPWQK